MTHGTSRQIVQDHESPRLRAALAERAIHPTIRIFPVPRDRVPQHAAIFAAGEMVDDRGLQQTIVKISTAAKRAKPTLRVREFTEQRLRRRDLYFRDSWVWRPAERKRMSVRVVADRVPFSMSALRQTQPLGIIQLLADHKESGSNLAHCQDIQHMRCHVRFRAVIK